MGLGKFKKPAFTRIGEFRKRLIKISRRLRNSLEEREVLKREPGRPKGANLFPVGALSLVKNVAVLRFFCAVSGWKNQVPTFFKARQEKGSLSPACECFPEIEELVRSDWDRGNREMRVYAALRVSQLPNI